MAAASRGAREAGGLTLGFLPGDHSSQANPWVELPLPTAMGEGRNMLVVRAGEAVVAVGGAWGTLSEIALARATGVEVVLLGRGPAEGLDLPVARSPGEACAWALRAAAKRRGSSSSHS